MHHEKDMFQDWCTYPLPTDQRIGRSSRHWCDNARSGSGLSFAVCGPDGKHWAPKMPVVGARKLLVWLRQMV